MPHLVAVVSPDAAHPGKRYLGILHPPAYTFPWRTVTSRQPLCQIRSHRLSPPDAQPRCVAGRPSVLRPTARGNLGFVADLIAPLYQRGAVYI